MEMCPVPGCRGSFPAALFLSGSEQGDVSSTFSHHRRHMMRRDEEGRARLFSVIPTDRAGVNGHKLNHMKFHLSTGKHFLMSGWSNTGTGGPAESPFEAIQNMTGAMFSR